MPELETLDAMDCPECSGPPPIFRLPPPPRPPFLTEASFCSEAPLAELEDCIAIPMIDASYHANPSLQNTALIITCAVILLLMAAIVSVVFWKHKRKVQNILPCKSAAAAAANQSRVLTNGQSLPITGTAGTVVAGNTLLYEDLMENTAMPQNHQYNQHMPIQPGIQSTIEVRDIITSRQPVSELTSTFPHLGYLDYRDPRSILCVSKTPSRAVLGGGYRTPQALLAKSKSQNATSSSINRLRNQNLVTNLNWQSNDSCFTNTRLVLLPNENNSEINSSNISKLPVLAIPMNGYNNSNAVRTFTTIPKVEISSSYQSRIANTSKFDNHALSYIVQVAREELHNADSDKLMIDNSKKLCCNHIRQRSVDSDDYTYIDFSKMDKQSGKMDINALYNCQQNFDSNNIDPSGQSLLERNIRRDSLLNDTNQIHKRINSTYSLSSNSLNSNFADATDEDMRDVNNENTSIQGGFVCSSPGLERYGSQDLYNPVYEELCNGERHLDTDEEVDMKDRNFSHYRQSSGASKSVSEDEFAEDELSVGEPSESRILTSSSGPVSWGTCPVGPLRSTRERRGRRSPRSLDRRRKNKTQDIGEFHEGMLLDALLHLYPSVAGIAGMKPNVCQRQKSATSGTQKLPYFVPSMPAIQTFKRDDENPYESVPVLGSLHHYSNKNRTNNKEKSRNTSTTERYDHYSQYSSEYFGMSNQNKTTPVYTQVGSDYSDTYAQPTDKLYHNDDKYAQPVYYTSRDPDQLPSGKLYQGQPDSSFGSDSGYSHHTSGGTNNCTTGIRNNATSKANHRKDKHRNSNNSQHSVEFIFS
ncbi:hypothetical protein PV327_001182 [Microctonus hyperodae]|uniref:Uncharacterized protein n=1 Tax=Microctonus hyperodae TaxID=165561 RepID=A0AA39G7R7_MICHY|nr:hypothetical protein PV327_001182 [Microctonus hyperodae]